MSGAIPPLPNSPSWHGAQLQQKHGDNSTFIFYFAVAAFMWMFCILMTYPTSYCCHYKLMDPWNACMHVHACVCVCVCVCACVRTYILKENKRKEGSNTYLFFLFPPFFVFLFSLRKKE
jgi:hypothetical protein